MTGTWNVRVYWATSDPPESFTDKHLDDALALKDSLTERTDVEEVEVSRTWEGSA